MNWQRLVTSPQPTTGWLLDGTVVAAVRRDREGTLHCAVEGMPSGAWEVGPVGLQSVDRERLMPALNAVQGRVEGARRAVVVVPTGWVRAHLLDFDEIPRRQAEVDQVVLWRLKKLLPVLPSELRVSTIPQRTGEGQPRLLCMVGVERAISELEESFAAVGVEPGLITPRLFALAQGAGDGARLLVQQEAGFLSLLLLVDGVPRLQRAPPGGEVRSHQSRRKRGDLGGDIGGGRPGAGRDAAVVVRAAGDHDHLALGVASVRGPGFGGPTGRCPAGTRIGVDRRSRAVIAPNLASRQFLNTRPVWLVTCTAGFLTAVFVVLNITSYLSSNRELAPQLDRLSRLRSEYESVSAEVRGLVAEFEKVPWRSLQSRVAATNVVLREWGFSWLALLDDIEEVIPREVRLIRIGPSVGPDEVTLSLRVVARSRDALIEFLDNLITDPRFSRPIPLREGLPEESAVAGYDLSLRVTYHPEELQS
jgi:hypothetical protein